MNVSAVIVTRGDVPLNEILDSLPREWEKIVVDNSQEPQDYKVYGRFVGCQRASHDIVMVQDDDCVLENPQELIDAWVQWRDNFGKDIGWTPYTDHIVCNMPAAFRHSFYQEHALIGFGGVFHRNLPDRVFRQALGPHGYMTRLVNDEFLRCCDIMLTALSPRVLVDVPYRDMEWASAPNRMWKMPTHRDERGRFLDRVLAYRDQKETNA